MSPELLEKLAGRRVVASISGGKDSAALSLHLRELGIEHDRVFLDTGWEHASTYEYLRGPLTTAIGPIVELRGPRLMEDLIRHKGMFPSRVRRFCTEELKVFPMQRHLKALTDEGHDVINAVGIRNDESAARASAQEWEWSDGFDCEVWRPLVKWTVLDVVAIHQRHGLRPNPLYLRGAERVGCWPCIHARKDEVRNIAEIDPAAIDRLRALEAEVGEKARQRYERDRAAWIANPDPEPPPADEAARKRWAAKKRRLEGPFAPPAWFQARIEDPEGGFPSWPIDKVVEWSRTSRGGTQFEMFAAAGRDQGCMRWGLCETSAPAANDAPAGADPGAA